MLLFNFLFTITIIVIGGALYVELYRKTTHPVVEFVITIGIGWSIASTISTTGISIDNVNPATDPSFMYGFMGVVTVFILYIQVRAYILNNQPEIAAEHLKNELKRKKHQRFVDFIEHDRERSSRSDD